MILKGELIAINDMLMGVEVDPTMRDEWVGKGRVIWSGCGDCSIGE